MASPGYRNLLKRITPLDRIALAIALLFLMVWIARIAGYSPPFAGFIEFCFFLSLGYLAYRMVVWARRRLLWGLRNRLIVAYIFIAVAPVVMLLAIGAITARMVYSQLAGYLLVQDIDRHMDVVADATESIASSLAATMPKSGAGSPGTLRFRRHAGVHRGSGSGYSGIGDQPKFCRDDCWQRRPRKRLRRRAAKIDSKD